MSHNFDPNQNYYSFTDNNSDPLVFIHGVGLDHRMWEPQINSLNSYSLITYDLLGHGKTPCNKDKLNLSTQTPTSVIPGVSPKGSPNKPSPKPILKIPKTSTAKISFIQLDPQDPASPTPQNPIPDTEMIVSYKHNDFKENFVEAVKVDVVNMHFKEKDSKKERIGYHLCSRGDPRVGFKATRDLLSLIHI